MKSKKKYFNGIYVFLLIGSLALSSCTGDSMYDKMNARRSRPTYSASGNKDCFNAEYEPDSRSNKRIKNEPGRQSTKGARSLAIEILKKIDVNDLEQSKKILNLLSRACEKFPLFMCYFLGQKSHNYNRHNTSSDEDDTRSSGEDANMEGEGDDPYTIHSLYRILNFLNRWKQDILNSQDNINIRDIQLSLERLSMRPAADLSDDMSNLLQHILSSLPNLRQRDTTQAPSASNGDRVFPYLQDAPLRGIVNGGTYCFLNASCQMLFNFKSVLPDPLLEINQLIEDTKVGESVPHDSIKERIEKLLLGSSDAVITQRPCPSEMMHASLPQDADEFFRHLMNFFTTDYSIKCSDETTQSNVNYKFPQGFSIPVENNTGDLSFMVENEQNKFIQDECSHFTNPVFNLPSTLYIQLYRISSGPNGSLRKINDPVNGTLHIKVKPNLKEHNTRDFDLQSFVVHTGSIEKGHYIAYVKRNQKWYEVNDRCVSSIADREIEGFAQRASMLFYKQN